jgi:hypothetical protein
MYPVSSCPAGTTLFVPGQSSICVNNFVIPYLKFYPLPNGPDICPCGPSGAGDSASYSFAGAQPTTQNYFTIRVDHRFSNKDSLAGSYILDRASQSQNDEFNNKILSSAARRQLVTLEETHVFSGTLVNSLRFGYNRIVAAAPSGAKAVNPLAADTSLGFISGDTAGGILGARLRQDPLPGSALPSVLWPGKRSQGHVQTSRAAAGATVWSDRR